MMLTGIMLIYVLGWYCEFIVPCMVGAFLVVVELIVFSFLPESPYFLLAQHKYDEAKASLSKFRSTQNCDDELNQIAATVRQKDQDQEKLQIKDIFLVKNYRKAMLIMTVLNAAQQLSGINVILMNMHDILSSAGSVYMDSSTTAIVFAGLMFAAAATASVTIDKFGRKKLLVCSSILTGFCLLALAVYFHIKVSGREYHSISWIPLVSVMAYGLVYKYGLGMVPIVLTAEIFAPKFKTVGMTLADGIYVTMAIISIQIYNLLRDYSGMHLPFYVFASCAFAAAAFVILFVPETKGKRLDEIQAILKGEQMNNTSSTS